MDGQWMVNGWLVGALEHEWIIFHFIYGMSSFPLTHIFQDGKETTNQMSFPIQSFIHKGFPKGFPWISHIPTRYFHVHKSYSESSSPWFL